jgi:hypothetical protein
VVTPIQSVVPFRARRTEMGRRFLPFALTHAPMPGKFTMAIPSHTAFGWQILHDTHKLHQTILRLFLENSKKNSVIQPRSALL